MATKKASKTGKLTPVEMAAFTENLKTGKAPAGRTVKKKVPSVGSVRSGRTADPRQMSLPGLADIWRAMPNHLARSSLFTSVARGRKKHFEGDILVSRKDAEIRFWGEQLDEAQSDVWMQVMYEAGKTPNGEKVLINRAEFLRSIGRKTGKFQYDWLKRTLIKLQRSVIMLTIFRKDGSKRWALDDSLNMIHGFTHDESAGTFQVKVDPEWKTLFGEHDYSLIDWTKRKQFGLQQDMAKSLQRLIATSKTAGQHYELGWLKDRLGSEATRPSFRRSLKKAFVELERLEIISNARIEKSSTGCEQAAWTRLG